jgi:hypothetical protein
MGAGWKQNWSSVARILGRSTHLKLHHAAILLPVGLMTPVGFGPRQLAVVELESTPLDYSGKVSLSQWHGICVGLKHLVGRACRDLSGCSKFPCGCGLESGIL